MLILNDLTISNLPVEGWLVLWFIFYLSVSPRNFTEDQQKFYWRWNVVYAEDTLGYIFWGYHQDNQGLPHPKRGLTEGCLWPQAWGELQRHVTEDVSNSPKINNTRISCINFSNIFINRHLLFWSLTNTRPETEISWFL